MRPPHMSGVVERRLLVNYRVDPEVVAPMLPAPLRPVLVGRWAVAGICLIRLGRLRPEWVPAPLGFRSENAAHRVAVEWDGDDGPTTGVYIPRRDSASAAAVVAGGRLFPGEHDRAVFAVRECPHELRVAFTSRDGTQRVSVEAAPVREFRGSTLFTDLAAASHFLRAGSVGWSATRAGRHLDGVEMRTGSWRVEPVDVRALRSSFFDDRDRFPPGSVVFDSALLMRDLPVTWKPLPPMRLPHLESAEPAPARAARGTG